MLTKLGPAPPPSEPEALGLWAAALLNPLPALGLAPEARSPHTTHPAPPPTRIPTPPHPHPPAPAKVRPSCLSCLESSQRLKIVLAALEVPPHPSPTRAPPQLHPLPNLSPLP